MGILQAAYETYESQSKFAGILMEGQTEPLLPVAHAIQNAAIEIEITAEGAFRTAKAVAKEDVKTIIPVTDKSASRVGVNSNAHPLCDQLQYLAEYGGEKFEAYRDQLKCWAESPFTHPKVQAVLAYIDSGTILTDLLSAGLITLNADGTPGDGKIQAIAFDKCLVRWRVLPAPVGVSTASWEDTSLFTAYQQYNSSRQAGTVKGLCAITGQEDFLTQLHPKGTVVTEFGAKLISANDKSGFTYRGRFVDAQQACSIGYTASQKAHSALRWLCANEGIIITNRTFLCWNPGGRKVPKPPINRARRTEGDQPPKKQTFTSYRTDLLRTLGGYRAALPVSDTVVVAALEAATTGRLSVTYFNQLRASDFLDRLQSWYESCCWNTRGFGCTSPALRTIVECAFGTERGNFIEADDRVTAEHTQQLLPCITECRPIPADVVRALAARASTPLAYSSKTSNWEKVLWTACAVLRKYHNDRLKREEYTLELDLENRDRSYVFGRLLAVLEQVERSTYDRDESRQPNAIRMQAVFAQRPLYAWRILDEALNPYFARMQPGLRAYYKNIIGEITGKLPQEDPQLGKRLDDTYLLGYYLQRTALTTKKKTEEAGETATTETEEN